MFCMSSMCVARNQGGRDVPGRAEYHDVNLLGFAGQVVGVEKQ